MPKLDLEQLKEQVRDVYKSKKRDEYKLGLGTDEILPPDFVPAPKIIQNLIGLPGYPICRLTMISGKPDSGKTTLGMLALIEAQKKDYYTILVDTEKKFDFDRMKRMGGDPNGILKVLATTIEDGFVGLDTFINTIFSQDPDGKVFIVWDSIGGTPTKAEAQADADESIQLATAAKVIKRNLRVFVQKFDKHQIGMLMINQMYANIGSHGYTNSGGEGVDYFSALIIQLSRISHYIVQEKGQQYKAGIDTQATVTKNHLIRGEKTLYRAKFRVKAYEICEITSRKKN